ncbi:MAG: 50S ribosomal protein L4 [Solirubrobacterales bacterium]
MSPAMKAPKLSGQGSIDLPANVFGERFHEGVVYEAVRAEQLARRRGTAATKTRAQASGGGAKPWRQKGTGRARIGSIRAPHWTGGGVAFGPAPRSYTVKINRKARKRALRAALSVHAERGSIAVVEASSFTEPATGTAADALDSWTSDFPVLVLLVDEEIDCAKSFRNIAGVDVLEAADAGVVDVLAAAALIASPAALEKLARLANEEPAGALGSKGGGG